jgi:very-short-patch-repair endonuclease
MTDAEAFLWKYLMKRQLLGFKFRRQYSVGRYILDFYCPARRLCIEVDGSIHDRPDVKAYDCMREQYIVSRNITVLRFTNEDVLNNISAVISQISESLSV